MACHKSTYFYILIFILLLLSYLIMPPYRSAFVCVPNCSRGFHSQRGLSVHQKLCRLFKQHQNESLATLAQQSDTFYQLAMAQTTAPERGSTVRTLLVLVENLRDSSSGTIQPVADIDDFIQPIDAMPTPPSPLPVEPPVEPPIEPAPVGRGHRKKRPTWKVLEQQARSHSNTSNTSVRNDTIDVPLPPVFNPTFISNQTTPNRFGLYSIYDTPVMTPPPDTDSGSFITPTPLDFVEPALNVPSRLATRALSTIDELAEKLKSCSNYSSAKVTQRYWNSPNKSLEDCDRLVHDVTVPSRPIVHVTGHTRVSELNKGHLSQVT